MNKAERIDFDIKRLDMMDTSDPEVAHSLADEILLAHVPLAIEEAYRELVIRCNWWAAA